MPRIFLQSSLISNTKIKVPGEKSHYLISVLRCRKGDELIVFNGEGDCFKTRIAKADKREVIAEVIEKFPCDMESFLNIILVQGLLKGEKMDIIIQKTTELGVNRILPVISSRSQVKETKRILRWRKIAEEAARQCGRNMVPIIQEPMRFDDFFQNSSEKKNGLIFYEEGERRLAETVELIKKKWEEGCEELYLAIGPEGGFTKEEIALAENKGLLVTRFGRRILRAETAAISAVALMQFIFGDIN